MVGGHDEQIASRIADMISGQAVVKMFQRLRVAFGVAAVAVEHVEIDKIAEDQAARIGVQRVDRLVDRLLVILRGQVLGHADRIVDRRDLADADDVEAGVLQQRQQISAGGGTA